MKLILSIGLGLVTFVLAGCQTDSTSLPAHVAAVELRGNTPGQIADVVVAVFGKHDFNLAHRTYLELVFEKQASRMDNLAYGNWISDQPVWLRVRVTMTPLSEARFRLECRPVLVLDKNQAMEEELKAKLRTGPYQKLLDEVAGRLRGEGGG